MAGLIACAAAASGCGGDGVTTSTSGGGQGGGGQGGSGAGTTSAGGQGGDGGTGGSGGSSPGGDAIYASGSRLRARILDGGGGASHFFDWFDSDLQQSCLFLQHEDGSRRCLPVGAGIGYRDAACTDPVVFASPCIEAPTFVSQWVSQEEVVTCDVVLGGQVPTISVQRFRAHAVGAAVPAPADVYYDYGNGDCQSIGLTSGASYFELGAVEPAESFIAVAIEPEPVAGGLVLEREVAADGAWLLHRVVGPDGVPCGPAPFGDETRCVPLLGAGLGDHYADASCTVPVASYPAADQGCPAPVYVARTVPDATGCGNPKAELLAIGAELDPSTLFANPQSCGALVPANPAPRYFAVGAPLSPGPFPTLVIAPRGSGRLRIAGGAEAIDGTWLTRHGFDRFIDTELDGGTPCELSYFEDGLYRCIAQSYLASSSVYFADAACTTQLYVVKKPVNGCAPADPPRFEVIQGGNVTCSEVSNNGTATEVRPFMAHTEAIYSGLGGGCTMIGPELAALYDFYALGDPSPLDQFPTLEVRVE